MCADVAGTPTGTILDLGCTYSTITDLDGTYTVFVSDISALYLVQFAVSSEGPLELYDDVPFGPSGYDASAVTLVPVGLSGPATGIDAVLDPTISGRVTDSSGAPLAGVGVCANVVTSLTGTLADLACTYQTVTRPDGTYTLVVSDMTAQYLVQFEPGFDGPLEIYADVAFTPSGYDASAVTLVGIASGPATGIDAVLE